VKGVAVMLLIDEPLENAARLLAPAASRSPSAEVKFILIEWARRAAVARRPAPLAAPVCAWAVAEPDPALRSRAAAACALAPDTNDSTLERLARDPEWQVRARLAASLASQRIDEGRPAVLNLLAHDPHPTVRRAATSRGLAIS
jgi:hypothetical protein